MTFPTTTSKQDMALRKLKVDLTQRITDHCNI